MGKSLVLWYKYSLQIGSWNLKNAVRDGERVEFADELYRVWCWWDSPAGQALQKTGHYHFTNWQQTTAFNFPWRKSLFLNESNKLATGFGQQYSRIRIVSVLKVEYLLNHKKRIWTGLAHSPLRSSCLCQSCSRTRLSGEFDLNEAIRRLMPGEWSTSLTTMATGRSTSRSSSWAFLISGSWSLEQQFWFLLMMRCNS